MTGVCEHVLSGHRVKVHVPKEGVTIAFAPSGVRAPQRGQPASRDGRPATQVPTATLASSFLSQPRAINVGTL